jgi:hypothetical protein
MVCGGKVKTTKNGRIPGDSREMMRAGDEKITEDSRTLKRNQLYLLGDRFIGQTSAPSMLPPAHA